MNDFFSIRTSLLKLFEEYFNQLTHQKGSDRKNDTAMYYMFCQKLLSELEELDNISANISALISRHDLENNYTERDRHAESLKLCLCLRKTVEEFLSQTEEIFKYEDTSYLNSVIRKTDTTIRKISILV